MNVQNSKRLSKIRSLLEKLSGSILTNPPVSPDLVLSDFHLFRNLKNYFSKLIFTTREYIENDLNSSYNSEPSEFQEQYIHKFVERLNEFNGTNGEYFLQ